MKTSKILFIVFFVLIAIVLGGITSKLFHKDGEEYIMKADKSLGLVSVEKEVPHFNNLIVEDGAHIWVQRSNSDCYFKFKEYEDSTVTMPLYEMRGDTLVLLSAEINSDEKVNLYVPNLDMCIARGRVELHNEQKSYKINVQGGYVNIPGQNTTSLTVEGSGGRVELHGKYLKSFKVNVSDTKVYLGRCNIDSATISAFDDSKVEIKQALNLTVRKDDDSRVIVK